jgi:hypothetical protein
MIMNDLDVVFKLRVSVFKLFDGRVTRPALSLGPDPAFTLSGVDLTRFRGGADTPILHAYWIYAALIEKALNS